MIVRSLSVGLFLLVAPLACASGTQPSSRSVATSPQARTPVASAGHALSAPAERRTAKQALLDSAVLGTTGTGKDAAPCWDPIRHAAIVNDLVDEGGRPYYLPAVHAFDIDDDGTPDPILAADRDETTTRWEIYVRRGGCAQHLGGVRVEGRIVGTLGVVNGVRKLEVVGQCDEGCDDVPHQELVFDGKKWIVGAKWTVPKRVAPRR
ncbi:MAG: hypothetical protein HYV09_19110 [Deltaproteobacteria bacterium]|nr:hypothetical protein [Deltaproteobacteria bacterium]